MKKIISLCLAAFISTGIFAAPPHLPDSSGKIKKVFHHDFPEVSNFKIYTSGNEYLVYFNDEENQSSGRVYYDADGNILQTYQYYSGEQLPPFIRAKIDKKYNGKSIFSVTEVTNSDQHYII
jgi:hypothetical protein